MKLSLLALAPLAAAGGGARGAISETLTDKLRDQGLPVAIDFLNAFKVPDLPGSWGIWSYGVKDIALSNIGADADIRSERGARGQGARDARPSGPRLDRAVCLEECCGGRVDACCAARQVR